jgi:hypothetical protein
MRVVRIGSRARRAAFAPVVAFAAFITVAPGGALLQAAPAGADAPDAATANVTEQFEAMARRLTESMTRDLGLSAIQVPEVEKTNLAAARRIQDAALQWKAGDKESTHNLVQQAVHAFTARESDLRAILTPDQQALFQQQRIVRGADMQTRVMQTTLKLDPAQTAKVSRLNLDTARSMQSALAPARDPSALPRQRYQALRAIREMQREKDHALHELLNKDQWKSYKQQKEEMKEMMREAWQQRGAS